MPERPEPAVPDTGLVSDEPPTGEHLLGPHVVGRRVVIRRLVRGETGPSGGPALSDTLGVAQSWGDTEVLVRREDGVVVTIQIADIVSGKPVPPRPSVHHRLSARACEEHTLALWPAMERVPLGDGDWVLRSDPAPVGRPLKRANSCLAMGEPGTSYDEALAAVRAFYTERGRDVLAQVEAGSEVERALLERGWQPLPHGDAEFRVGSLAKAQRARRSLRAGAPADAPRIELVADGSHAVVGVRDAAGLLLATGRGSLHRDWLALHGLHVVPAHRRRGMAGLVLDELFDWAGESGAGTVWLHVESANTAALTLYGALGLVSHHTARYLSSPA